MNPVIIDRYNQYQEMLNNYASIVDKTNQQLSVWSNPYGIMIGILTLVVALIAIVVAWYIFKSSKEQKDLFKETLVKYQNSLEEQAKLLTEQKKIEIDKTIKEFEKIKESVTEEKKAEFQKVIDEYKKEKEKIYNEPVNIQYDNNHYASSVFTGVFNDPIKSIHCSTCGTFFKYKDDNDGYFRSPASVMTFGTRKKVYCPKCNAENFI